MLYSVGQHITPDQAMRFAIETAKQGLAMVSPNPLVGCVIVDKNHNFLSAGAHLKAGKAHAEINALKSIASENLLKGATVYVTLEPCAHQGKTGSCAKALSELPIKKVFYGAMDPNPLVAGRGLQVLMQAKIEVELFDRYKEACLELAEQFHFHMAHQCPFVAIKVGSSLDGKMALKNGQSQWITGEEARKYSRKLRAHYDATMIGAGTLNYDNPTLDFRDTEFAGLKENRVVILDPKGKGADRFKETNIFKTHGYKNIFVLTRLEYKEKWNRHLVHVIDWDSSPGGWQDSLKNLYLNGITSLFVEGGSFVFGQLLQNNLINKIYLFQSPKILGEGVSWSQYFYNDNLSEVPSIKGWNSLMIGQDRLNIGYFTKN